MTNNSTVSGTALRVNRTRPRPITDTWTNQPQANASTKTAKTYRLQYAPDVTQTNVRLCFGNVCGYQASNGEDGSVAAMTVTAALANTAAGTLHQVTFNGATSVTLNAGETIWSDPVTSSSITAGTRCEVRWYQTSTTQFKLGNNGNSGTASATESNSTNDDTTNAGAAFVALTDSFLPSTYFGMCGDATTRKITVYQHGDSIGGDVNYGQDVQAGGTVTWKNNSRSGEAAYNHVPSLARGGNPAGWGSPTRTRFARDFDVLFNQLGANDLRVPSSTSQHREPAGSLHGSDDEGANADLGPHEPEADRHDHHALDRLHRQLGHGHQPGRASGGDGKRPRGATTVQRRHAVQPGACSATTPTGTWGRRCRTRPIRSSGCRTGRPTTTATTRAYTRRTSRRP